MLQLPPMVVAKKTVAAKKVVTLRPRTPLASFVALSVLGLAIGFGAGYTVGAASALQKSAPASEAVTQTQTVPNTATSAPVFSVGRNADSKSELVMKLGAETKSIFTSDHPIVVTSTLTPYSGLIVLQEIIESEAYKNLPALFDVAKGNFVATNYSRPLPKHADAIKYSPDGKTLAAIYRLPSAAPVATKSDDKATAAKTEPVTPDNGSGEIVFFDVASGVATVVGQLAPNEWASRYAGGDLPGGIKDVSMRWNSTFCLDLTVYREPAPDELKALPANEKVLVAGRTYCKDSKPVTPANE